MASHVVLEGVNLEATIFDTDDLSTVRGSSMILERLAAMAAEKLDGIALDSGASRASIRIDAPPPDLEARVLNLLAGTELAPFTIAFGIGATEAEARRAAALYRVRGMWSTSLPSLTHLSGDRPCPLNGVRAVADRNNDFDGAGQARRIAPSTAARRTVGRHGRPHLFKRQWDHPQSFVDIVAPDKQTGFPFVTRQKIALVVADGIGGSDLRRAFVAATGCEAQSSAAYLQALDQLRHRLAHRIEDWAVDAGLETTRHGSPALRLDVLVWGGDDMTFALPATHLLGFLEMFFDEIAKPLAPGLIETGFPHRVGCIVAQLKTPVRLVKRLASDAETSLKNALKQATLATGQMAVGRSAFTIDVFESSALPWDGVLAYRRSLYGPGYRLGDDLFLDSDVAGLIEFPSMHMASGSAEHCRLSPAQIHRALEAVRKSGKSLSDGDATRIVSGLIDDHHLRLHGQEAPMAEWRAAFTAVNRRTPLFLAQLAQLLPYLQAAFLNLQPSPSNVVA